MDLDKAFLAAILREGAGGIKVALDLGVGPESFNGLPRTIFEFIIDYAAKYKSTPTVTLVATKFAVPDLDFNDQGASVNFLAGEVRNRATHIALREGLAPVLTLLDQHQPLKALEQAEELVRSARKQNSGTSALDERVWVPTAADLDADPKDVDWLWWGLIEAQRVLVLTGQGGVGKTALSAGLAVHRAVGRDFLGRSVKPGKSIFLSAEDDRFTFHRKMRAYMQQYPEITSSQIAGKVVPIDLTGLGIRFISGDGRSYSISPDVGRVIRLIKRHCPGADLVFIETASRFAGGDESNDAMTTLNEAANQMARELGAAVIFSHHTGKANTREARSDAYVGRGASSFSDAARGSLHMVDCSTMETSELTALLGHEPTADEKTRLVVLHNNKPSPNAPKAKPMVLERVANVFNIVYREYNGSSLAASAGGISVRDACGWKLKMHVLEMAAKGVLVSKSQLRDSEQMRKALDVKKAAMSDVVTNAIADEYLCEDGPKKGGYPTLRPGPRNLQGGKDAPDGSFALA